MVLWENDNNGKTFLCGTVTAVDAPVQTSSGHRMIIVHITGDGTYDPISGQKTVNGDTSVAFIDRPDGLYGPQMSAELVEKKHLQTDMPVIIKAQHVVTMTDPNNPESDQIDSYYGSGLARASSMLEYRATDTTPRGLCIMGPTIVRQMNGKLSVPLNFWDRTANGGKGANVAVYAAMSEKGYEATKTGISEDTANALRGAGENGHRHKTAAFYCPEYKIERDPKNRFVPKAVTAVFAKYEML